MITTSSSPHPHHHSSPEVAGHVDGLHLRLVHVLHYLDLLHHAVLVPHLPITGRQISLDGKTTRSSSQIKSNSKLHYSVTLTFCTTPFSSRTCASHVARHHSKSQDDEDLPTRGLTCLLGFCIFII
jgi:hypothetical protein